MIPLSLRRIGELTAGRVTGTTNPDDVTVDGPVVTDSREAVAGSLYVARVGEHADGHDFVAAAAERGAVAALTTRPVEGLPCVVVDDVQEAFAGLSRALVDARPDLTVVGVTGSSGKTSTKDLLAVVLGDAGETVAPVGSYNSEVGVPLTVCQVTPTTRFLVVEMGARGVGHISYLARIAPPRIGAVLNVGVAHVGEFGSTEAIATAKAELVESLPADGVAVLNADDPAVRAMASRTAARVVLVGEADDAELRAEDVTLDRSGHPTFTLVDTGAAGAGEAGTRHTVTLPQLVGRHHVGNVLTVLAVARACGVPLAQAISSVSRAVPASRWRMEVSERADGVTVVNDAYNANPDSMRAALAALETIGEGRRTWAVLGTMLELGESSDAEHAEIGRETARRGIDELLVVGRPARPMAEAARAAGCATRVRHVDEAAEAEAVLEAGLRPGDVVLLKSSRDAGLRFLGERVAAGGSAPRPSTPSSEQEPHE